MLKRMTIKKISIATILLFICFLFVLFPKEDKVINLDGKEIIEYSFRIPQEFKYFKGDFKIFKRVKKDF